MESILANATDESAPAAASPLNDPGRWHFFLSQHQAMGGDQGKTLHLLLKGLGKTTWYDQAMADQSEAAMEEGVRHSDCFILLLTAEARASDVPDTDAVEPREESPEAAAALAERGYCFHLALQAPQMLIGQTIARGVTRVAPRQYHTR